ncbi:MAG TPA: hypothetical protein PKD12_08145 [Nitrospira sp.]|nr:hypothetical protein [Nitrospira sp.]
MFTSRRDQTKLQLSIDLAHVKLQALDPISKEYDLVLDQLIKLHKMQDADRPKSISPDVLVSAATNLLGILLIINHERTGIVTSKALSFVPKTR